MIFTRVIRATTNFLMAIMMVFASFATLAAQPPAQNKVEGTTQKEKPGGVVQILADIGGAIAQEWKESLSEHEQKFLEQVFLPVIGPEHREESSRLGSWLMGLDPTVADANFSPVNLVVTFVDNYGSNLNVLGVDRKHIENQADKSLVVNFARIQSRAKQTRVIITAVVEQRPRNKEVDFHLYNIQVEYELMNNFFIRKSHSIYVIN